VWRTRSKVISLGNVSRVVPGTGLWEPIHLVDIAMVWLLPVSYLSLPFAGCN